MNKQVPNLVEDPRRRTMTVSDAATPFGCCNYFDACADEIFTLYYKGGLDLLDWMGFNVTEDCLRAIEFLTYNRPEQSGDADTPGYLSDPCANPHGTEFGSCSLSVESFGRYGRSGRVRDLFTETRYCKTSPRHFLDGSRLEYESDWDKMFAMDQVLNDVRVDIIQGNIATPGQFDGLRRWVRTGFAGCGGILDSYVVNWNNNPLTGGAGITINGAAAPAGFDFVSYLQDIFRNWKQRISWSPVLHGQARRVGDTILVLPGFLARCLLDFFTCWSVCPTTINTTTDATRIVKGSLETRDFRIQLNGGLFGHGKIELDGFEIPLLQYDWGMINGPTRGDVFFLTGSVGSQRIWEGEHLSADVVLRELGRDGSDTHGFQSLDGGRVLSKVVTEGTCRQQHLWHRPRLWCMAPWLQARFINVACHTPTGPLSPDPGDASFYPLTSFSPAVCP